MFGVLGELVDERGEDGLEFFERGRHDKSRLWSAGMSWPVRRARCSQDDRQGDADLANLISDGRRPVVYWYSAETEARDNEEVRGLYCVSFNGKSCVWQTMEI